MATAGYSATALVKKLGIKPGFKTRLINPPANYFELLTDVPENVQWLQEKKSHKDLIHFFTDQFIEIEKNILMLRAEIFPDGMLWISWPKKASKKLTDITEDKIRHIALQNGLVDIKVCAIDETWSGLKLVVPVKDRKPKP